MLIQSARNWLNNFTPYTTKEDEHKKRIIDLLHHPEIANRKFFSPGHLTASAMVLSPDLQQMLLIYHSGFEAWIQPGGHVDPTDGDLLSTAKREIAEECQIFELDFLLNEPSLLQVDIHNVPPNKRKQEPAHEHYDLRFVFVSRTWTMQAASDAKDAQWLKFDQFDPKKSDESVTESVRRLNVILASETKER
jgi:8-oxo-dGTP pyrophosphatase MutT (NUDIX family)